jgi:hypothetical protein
MNFARVQLQIIFGRQKKMICRLSLVIFGTIIGNTYKNEKNLS